MHLSENLKYLRKKRGETQASIASIVGKAPTTVGNWETGLSAPSLEELEAISNFFGVAIDDIIKVDLSKAHLIEKSGDEKNSKNTHLNTHLLTHPKDKKQPKIYSLDADKRVSKTGENPPNYGASSPSVITLSESGEDNIVYVPVKARAGYLLGYGDPNYIQKLESFRVPGMRHATFRMFEAEGQSMAPGILSGDRIIGAWVPSINEMTDNRVHIVVTKTGIVIKRVLNRILQRGKLVLKSDTIEHRLEFKTIEIDPEEVVEMWEAKLKLSADFSDPSDIYVRINDLENNQEEMRQLLETLAQNLPAIKAKK